MKFVVNKFREFRQKQDGNATIEFVILFPGLMFLFLIGFEAGYYMVRNVSIERAVDVVVREVRLSNGQIPNLAQFKQRVCNEASIFDNCESLVKVDVEPIAKGAGAIAAIANGPVRCVDSNAANNGNAPDDIYDVGAENQMMVMRVCVLAQPMFPTTGLGVGMKYDTDGNLAIVSTTAFVNEPGSRAINPPPPPPNNGGGAGGNCGTGNGVGCGTGYGGGNGNNTGQGAANGNGVGGNAGSNSGNGGGNNSGASGGTASNGTSNANNGGNNGNAGGNGNSGGNANGNNGGGSGGSTSCGTGNGVGCGTGHGGGNGNNTGQGASNGNGVGNSTGGGNNGNGNGGGNNP